MRLNRVVGAASVLAVTSAASLRADFKDFSNICTPGAVRACVSMQVFTTLNGSGGTNVTILVRNLQGGPSWLGDNSGGSLIRRIGLVAPNVTGATGLAVTGINGATTVGNPAANWVLSNPGGLGGLITLTAGTSPAGIAPGAIQGCSAPAGGSQSAYFQTCNGGWVQLTFTTTNAWSASTADVAVLTSNYAVGGVGVECDTDNLPAPRVGCVVATPEPVTMILLGSGLASMGGFGLVRRRKGTDVING